MTEGDGVHPAALPGEAIAEDPRRAVRGSDLLWAAFRLLHIQAIMTPERMQGIGFSYAMAPILRRLYPDRSKLAEALSRHTGYFATHPVLAGYALGAAARLEANRAAGDPIRGDRIDALKRALASPLAALGDPLFWVTLRPLAGLVGVLGLALFAPADPTLPDSRVLLCPFLLLLTYNALALPTRWRGVSVGFAGAQSPAEIVRSLHLADWRDALEKAGALLYGALLVLVASGVRAATASRGSGSVPLVAALVPLVLGMVAARMSLRRAPSASVETGLIVFALAAVASLAV